MPRAPFGPNINDPLTRWPELLAYLDAAKAKSTLPRAAESKALGVSSQGLVGSFDMLPEFTPDDFPGLAFTDTKPVPQALVCPSPLSIKTAYQANIILCDLGLVMSLPFCATLFPTKHVKGVEYVLGACYPLKVLKAVISFDSVEMVYLKTWDAWWLKRKHDQAMDMVHFALTVFAQSNKEIRGVHVLGHQFSTNGLAEAGFSGNTEDTPNAGHPVIAFIARNVAPFFGWGLCRRILRGMINHTSLLIRLVMAQGVSAPLSRFYSLYYTTVRA